MTSISEPITVRFEVRCSAEQAFTAWTTDVSLWWPRDHTVSGDEDAEINFEAGAGGRLFERSAAAGQIDWGRVVVWEPPRRVAYRWYLGFSEDEATDVEVTFTEQDDGSTVVELVHSGWEHLGAAASVRRDRNRAGWAGVVSIYQQACLTRRFDGQGHQRHP